ncbi:MAG: amidohydrolase family protein [Anaerolineae bacterium]
MPMHDGLYQYLRTAIAALPVIDCHQHTWGPQAAAEATEPLQALISGYVQSDLESAIFPGDAVTVERFGQVLNDGNLSTADKWPVFAPIWRRMEHTAYAQVTKRVLRDFYGEPALTLEALQRIAPRLLNLRDPEVYAGVLDRAGVRCRLTDLYYMDLGRFLAGEAPVYERDRLLIPLPRFHAVRSWQQVWDIASLVGAAATSLDGYLQACREVFARLVKLGAIGMKDQSAYNRSIAYSNPSRAEAEALFNRVMADPRQSLGWPEAQPLDDWLFHRFMEMAREMDLPVQIHTGHMAGARNEIAKTNAVLLTPVLELHRDVRFDLFHGNWPYMGEALFLAKNHANVRLDLCWVHIIDPVYARQMLEQGLVTVPHSKFHAYGGDYHDEVLHAVAHLEIARDVVAEALAERVRAGWLSEAEALQVAADWFFNNPNEYFRLGFETVRP